MGRDVNILTVYQGVIYPTLAAACEAAGISPSTVHNRSTRLQISKQEAFDQAVVEGVKTGKTPIVYKGVTYPTIASACEAASISRNTVYGRSTKFQISMQEAFDQVVAKVGRKPQVSVVHQGVTYPTLPAACKAAGINVNTVYTRSHELQISHREAFDQLVSEGLKRANIPIMYQGVIYPSVSAACEAAGINQNTVYARSTKLQISAQEAFDQVVTNKDNSSFKSRSICKSFNDLVEVKHAYVSRSGTTYLTCTCKTCNRRILLPYETAKNYRHAEEFCVDHEYKGRH